MKHAITLLVFLVSASAALATPVADYHFAFDGDGTQQGTGANLEWSTWAQPTTFVAGRTGHGQAYEMKEGANYALNGWSSGYDFSFDAFTVSFWTTGAAESDIVYLSLGGIGGMPAYDELSVRAGAVSETSSDISVVAHPTASWKDTDYAGSAGGTLGFDSEGWSMITVTADAAAGELKTYVNGVLQDTAAYTHTGTISSVALGYSQEGRQIVTAMDDLMFFDGALTEAEVATLVPEPATMSLLALGAIGMIRKRRRS